MMSKLLAVLVSIVFVASTSLAAPKKCKKNEEMKDGKCVKKEMVKGKKGDKKADKKAAEKKPEPAPEKKEEAAPPPAEEPMGDE